ncbi:MAG: ABC transporter permease [Clostridia bacterium]|nr:ABC transporter permease [Clostridia bacterium]
MKSKRFLKDYLRSLILVAVIVIASLAFYFINPGFLRMSNIANIFSGYAVYGIMAVGMMMVICTGNIDVSVGAQLAVVSMVVASMAKNGTINNAFMAFVVCIACGLVLGLANGALVAFLKLPAIIVTLGTLNIMRGTMLLVYGSSWVNGLPAWFTAIARTMPLAGIGLRFKMTVFVWLFIAVLSYLLMYHTVLGRKVLAVGANPDGASRIGFRPSTSYIFSFAIMGVTSGIGALFYTANVGMAQPVAGNGYEMTLIAAVVIGGTSFSGGKISVLGTFLGVLLLSIVESGMVICKVPVYWQELVKGAVIIIAILSAAMEGLGGKGARKRKLKGVGA